MPECKALKTFHSDKYGMLRAGTRFSSEKGYAVELQSRGLVEILPNEPQRTQAFAGAPMTQGLIRTEDLPVDGEAKPFVSSRAGPASHKPTVMPSKPSGNAKR
jgi:hypothetical protein